MDWSHPAGHSDLDLENGDLLGMQLLLSWGTVDTSTYILVATRFHSKEGERL